MTFQLKHLVVFPFLLMLLAGVSMPSDGSHGLLNIKSLAFLVTSFGLLAYVCARQFFFLSNLKMLAFFIFGLAFLFAWEIVGLTHGETFPSSIFDQFKIFLITLCTVVYSYYLVEEKLLSYQTFVKTLVYANFSYSLVKVGAVILHLLNIVSIFKVMEVTNLRFMSMDMGTGMIRMQTSIDILTPFLLYFVLQSDKLNLHFGKAFKACYCIISCVSVLLSFSRVLIFAAFLSFALYWFTQNLPRFLRSMAIFTVLLMGAVSAIGWENVGKMIEKRLFSTDNFNSDQTRNIQIAALMSEYEAFPLLGKGLGGYSEELKRDDKIFHSYEVQWVAFLMQFGPLGIGIILAGLGGIVVQYLVGGISRVKISFLLLFGCWLVAGFTNPFLISLTSGIVYSIFLLTGRHLQVEDIYTCKSKGGPEARPC